MSTPLSAFDRVREIEAAVEAGDLEAANVAAAELMPALVNERIEDMVTLRERINALSLGVKHLQTQHGAELKQIRQQRGGVTAYRTVQSHTG